MLPLIHPQNLSELYYLISEITQTREDPDILPASPHPTGEGMPLLCQTIYLPSERVSSSMASFHRPHPPLAYSSRPPSHHSDTKSRTSSRHYSSHSPTPSRHTSHAPSYHSSSHTHPQLKNSPPITYPIHEGPPTTLCTFSKTLVELNPNNRTEGLHFAKHVAALNPLDASGVKSKLFHIALLRRRGIDCTDIGLNHWGQLTPDPFGGKVPNMSDWTVRAQLEYYLADFERWEKVPPPGTEAAFWREARETYAGLTRCIDTMGCMDCRHDRTLKGNPGRLAAKMEIFEEMVACHDRRTGHGYAPGCCGNGACWGGGDMEMIERAGSVQGMPRERSVLQDGGSVAASRRESERQSVSGSADVDSRPVPLSGSSVSYSRYGSQWGGNRRDSQVGSSHGRHVSSRSRYDRSEASGWLKPTCRSERGVPGSVAGSGVSEGDISSILPGESFGGYGERQRERRRGFAKQD